MLSKYLRIPQSKSKYQQQFMSDMGIGQLTRLEHNRKFDLICFDFDGTLAVADNNLVFWSCLQKRFGIPAERDNERRRLHSLGLFSSQEWADANIQDWIERGIKREDILAEIQRSLRLHKNAREVLHRLKAEGYKLALVSNSLSVALETIFPDHPFDHVFIGDISFDTEGNIATWEHKVHQSNKKEDILLHLAQKEGIDRSKIVFVGDDMNDLNAMNKAALSIAFNARHHLVRQEAMVVIDETDYSQILPHLLHKI